MTTDELSMSTSPRSQHAITLTTHSNTKMIVIQSSVILALFTLFLPEVNSLSARGSKASTRRARSGGFGTKPNSIVHSPDNSASTQHLIKFLKSQKSEGLGNIEIGYRSDTGVRGLFATKSFKQGQILCKIPSDCALALSDPAKNGEDTPTMAHGGANFLNMYMKPSYARQLWAPYLDTLPTIGSANFDPTPDFFSDEELELLEFPRLIRQAKERRQQVQAVADELGLTTEELQFATWLTASRAFSISMTGAQDDTQALKYDDRGQVITKVGEQKTIRVLVPFIDMANHSSDQPNTKLMLIDPEKDDAWFALEATRPIAPGKEITIAYGNGIESSVELLMNYGFVPQVNRIDVFMLKKGGDDSIPNLEGWSTTLEEDKSMLSMVEGSEDHHATLKKILNFRIRLKESYA